MLTAAGFDTDTAVGWLTAFSLLGFGAADDALASWVQRGLDFASVLPAKPVRASG